MCVYIDQRSMERATVPIGPWENGSLTRFLLHTEPTPPMRNPVDRAIKAMTFGAGFVGLLLLTVFQLL